MRHPRGCRAWFVTTVSFGWWTASRPANSLVMIGAVSPCSKLLPLSRGRWTAHRADLGLVSGFVPSGRSISRHAVLDEDDSAELDTEGDVATIGQVEDNAFLLENMPTENAAATKLGESRGMRRNKVVEDKGGVSADRLAFEELGTREVDRLFSNLEPCDVTGFKHKPGNLLGATALVGGTTVGAGILALPAATIQAGFIPSSLALIFMWVYMASTGLLIAEVNVNVICRQGTPGVGLITLAEKALGKDGSRLTGMVYVFIHYALLVAYMAQGGELLYEPLVGFLSRVFQGAVPPEWIGPVLFCAGAGGVVILNSEEVVSAVNSALVGLLLVVFSSLLVLVGGGMHGENLMQLDWGAVPATIPVMYIAMVFHNIVPVVTTQLEGNVDKIRTAIVGGSAAPLAMFLAWNAVILGTVPREAATAAVRNGGVFDPLQMLREGVNGSGGNMGETVSTLIGPLITVFSEVAIITSFIGFVVGLLDFFTDVFGMEGGTSSREVPLYALILLPPLALAATDPQIFFSALDSAGTFGISLLCGVLPAAMAWQQRYQGSSGSGGNSDEVVDEVVAVATLPLVPGGKATLAGIAGFAGVVIFQKLLEIAGLVA